MKKEEENNTEINKENKNMENSLKDFDFILKRSKNINKIIELKNPIKKIDYTFTREESFSDEILNYLTQLNDKINQFKYNASLTNSNQKSNFHIYNINYTTEIDAFYDYEFFKNDVHNNPKAYNVHEHRKIPFDEEKKRGKRRNYKDFEGGGKNNFEKINYYEGRRSVSLDRINKNFNKNNYATDAEKNKDKVTFGGIKEFKSNNIDNEEYDNDFRMDNAYRRRNKRKEYCSGLTSYDPFRKKKKKYYKEDEDNYL